MRTIKTVLIFVFFLAIVFEGYSLETKRQLQAVRTSANIKVDGNLDEAIWASVPVAKDFRTYQPTIGESAGQESEIRVVYDNRAIYIGAILFDNSPDSIFRELTKRDNVIMGNVDHFKISLNPYNDGQNIFQFEVSAANVQADSKKSVSGGSGMMSRYMRYGDYSWNAVWKSSVKITDEGWIVEVEIPYAAIRFSKEEVQTWGVNFWRTIRRTRETSVWNPVDRSFAEEDQNGELVGISSIKAPLRLELYPFAAGYYHINEEGGSGFSYAAGMDLKYGITEAFTLDMTLIPDFGQRKSDDIILNLTPYETKYRENRQFFTEGIELFNKAGLFYSRRIGKQPDGYYDVYDGLDTDRLESLDNPQEVKLINATKVSGRNANNLGVGVFNAMTANTYAKYKYPEMEEEKILTEPFTNYNMFVLDQIIGRSSYINLTNTNVLTPSSTRMANVTGLSGRYRDKNNMYGVNASVSYSAKFDSLSVEPGTGYSTQLGFGKYGGAFNVNYSLSVISDTYDPNDMGYLRHNNGVNHDVFITYRILEPFSIFNSMSYTAMFGYDQLYAPSEYSRFGTWLSARTTFKNYWDLNLSLKGDPFKGHDWYETRADGWFYERPANVEFDLSASTDYRKKVGIHAGLEYNLNTEDTRGWEFSLRPRWRVNNKLSLSPRIEISKDNNQVGYASYFAEDSIAFGKRDVRRVTNQLSASYVFNNKSALSLSMRHYWSAVDYKEYYLLQKDGTVADYPEYGENEDLNFNTLSVDLEYSWNLAPGSFLTMVWKNNIYNPQEIEADQFTGYIDNFNTTLRSDQSNSFSIKLTYYVDYQQVIRPHMPFPR